MNSTGIHSVSNGSSIDKKYIIALASAAAILSAAAALYLRKRKSSKKSSPKEEPKEEPVAAKPVVGPQTSDEVDFSNLKTVDEVFNMAYRYMASLEFGKVVLWAWSHREAIKCYSRCIKMAGMKDLEKRKLYFNSRANAYLTMACFHYHSLTRRRTSTEPSATSRSASTCPRWTARRT